MVASFRANIILIVLEILVKIPDFSFDVFSCRKQANEFIPISNLFTYFTKVFKSSEQNNLTNDIIWSRNQFAPKDIFGSN